MREKLIASLETGHGPEPPQSIQYYLLEEIRGTRKTYGIKVVEMTAQASAVAPGLTRDKRYAFRLIGRLAEGCVPPTGLADVLADLLW